MRTLLIIGGLALLVMGLMVGLVLFDDEDSQETVPNATAPDRPPASALITSE